jgi:hypothetical protein
LLEKHLEEYIQLKGAKIIIRSLVHINFKVFEAVSVQPVNLLVVTLCSIVDEYQCSRGTCCLHFHGSNKCSKDAITII